MELIHIDEDHARGTCGPVLLLSIHGRIRRDIVGQVYADLRGLAAAHHGVALIAQVVPTTVVLPARRRAAVVDAARSEMPMESMVAQAGVVPGSSLNAMALRALWRGFNLLSQRSHPQRVFAAAPEATAFVEASVREAGLAPLPEGALGAALERLAQPRNLFDAVA